jgi:hypothetical protein
MDIQELMATATSDTHEHFRKKLSEFVYGHYKYHNLSSANQKLIMDIIYKHTDAIRNGIGISNHTIEEENYKLYENRIRFNLSPEDLEDIKEILDLFKK